VEAGVLTIVVELALQTIFPEGVKIRPVPPDSALRFPRLHLLTMASPPAGLTSLVLLSLEVDLSGDLIGEAI
jgi:hypothetical protein